MSRVIFFFLLSILPFKSISQSKYDFVIGFDSIAYKYSIRSKETFEVRFDSLSIDTISRRIESYDTNGFIVKIEYEDWLNRNLRRRRGQNFYVEFKYNSDGYLISENVNWLWNVGKHGSDTTRIIKTENWAFVDDSEILISTETKNEYPNEPEWIEKCFYSYHKDGRTKMIECFYLREGEPNYTKRTVYNYFENDLIREIYQENESLVFERKYFNYEFYH